MVNDARTPKRNYPVPAEGNTVAEDFPRLRMALQAIDVDVDALLTSVAGRALLVHTHTIAQIVGLQTALDGKMNVGAISLALGDLNDVSVAGAATLQVLMKGPSGWQPGVVSANNLNDWDAKLAASSIGAGQITGVLDPARIPVLQSQVTIISAGAISALTAGQQNQIGQGTHVTTTDGRRWIYSGTGSKTVEASYIELADVTPEWGVIANKPTTFAGLTLGWGDVGSVGRDLVAATTQAQGRAALGLGTAAPLNVGTGANEVMQWGAANTYRAGDGSAITNTPGFRAADLWVRCERAQNTSDTPANLTVGVYITRALNVIKRNTIGATLASDRITLPAGTYYARWKCVAASNGGNPASYTARAKLYNVTSGADIEYTNTETSYSSIAASSLTNTGEAVFTVGPSTAVDIRQMSGINAATTGNKINAPGEPEIYSSVEMWKIG